MVPQKLRTLQARQAGVVSRAQALSAGATPVDIRSLCRRREWAALHPGVYVDHTGPPTWRQRAWAAVLAAGESALDAESALHITGRTGWPGVTPQSPIRLVIPEHRRVQPISGIRVRRLKDFARQVQPAATPPRLRAEHATLAEAARRTARLDAVEVIATACRLGVTTPHHLLRALDSYPRFPRRCWMRSVLIDVAGGTCSVLEHGYLTRVERPHRLPTPERQVADRTNDGMIYRDAEYPRYGVIIELDGAAVHEGWRQRDRDSRRDLDVAAERLTVRIGWSQVFDRACLTAWQLGQVLQARGWDGRPRACSAHCPVTTMAPDQRGRSESPTDSDLPI